MSIEAKSKQKYIWDSFVLLITTLAAIEIPLRLVLKHPQDTLQPLAFASLILVYILDIIIQKNTVTTPFGKSKQSVEIIHNYYKRSYFIIDILACIPFDFIYLLIFPGAEITDLTFYILRLTHLIKLLRIGFYLKRCQRIFNFHPSILRLSTFIFIIGIFAHWISCSWMVLTSETRTVTDYIDALYWCITTLTTVGYGDITPHGMWQKIFTMIIMLLGAGTYGYIIGNISSILANLDVAKTNFNKKVDKVNTFLKSYNFPKKTSARVNDYYNYLWKTDRGYDSKEILDELPETIRLELQLHLTQSIIEKVPLFKEAEEKMLKEIVSTLNPHIFIPGDTIFNFGDAGDTMYFVNRGAVEVLSEDCNTVYSTLSEGSFFGEIALLLDQPRNATVKAADYCNLYSLGKKTFNQVISNYPEFKRTVREMVAARVRE